MWDAWSLGPVEQSFHLKACLFLRSQLSIPAVTVQQTWYQYSLQVRGEDKVTTIPDGVVVLPKRTVQTRWVDLLSGAFGKIIEYTINASIGSSDILIISAFGYESKSFLDGEGLGDTVVLKRH